MTSPRATATSGEIREELERAIANPDLARIHTWRMPNTSPRFDNAAYLARLELTKAHVHKLFDEAVASIGAKEVRSGD
jgi:hypothetical protein